MFCKVLKLSDFFIVRSMGFGLPIDYLSRQQDIPII